MAVDLSLAKTNQNNAELAIPVLIKAIEDLETRLAAAELELDS